jgi:hypothetical protein
LFAYSRIVACCKAMGGEKRMRRPPWGSDRITGRNGPEQATKMPEMAESFDLPNARIGAMAADFRAARVQFHVASRQGLRSHFALPIPCHQR